jgi:hypothetical protein
MPWDIYLGKFLQTKVVGGKVLQTNSLGTVCATGAHCEFRNGKLRVRLSKSDPVTRLGGRRGKETQIPLPHDTCFIEVDCRAIGHRTQRHVIRQGKEEAAPMAVADHVYFVFSS